MAKKRKKIQTRWGIFDDVHGRVAAYKALHKLKSLEVAANMILDKGTESLKLPE